MKYVIKCYKCGKKYVGERRDQVIRDNALFIDGKGYFCSCEKPKRGKKHAVQYEEEKKTEEKIDDIQC